MNNQNQITYWNLRSTEYEKLFYESQHRIEVMNRISEHLNPLSIRSLLDLGCGPGIVTESMIANIRYERLLLLDLSPDMLSLAHSRLGSKITESFCQSLSSRLPFRDATVDTITSCFAIHHISDEEKQLLFNEIARILTKDGNLIIADEIIFNDKKSLPEVMMELFYPKQADAFYKRVFGDFKEYPSRSETLTSIIKHAGLRIDLIEELSPITGIIKAHKP